MKKEHDHITIVAENRKARQRYHVEEHYETGIVLTGSEIKSLRQGSCQLMDAYAHFHRGELFLGHMHIGAYTHGGYANHTPVYDRKLLMHKNELKKLAIQLDRRGYTLVPLSVYFNQAGKVKVRLGLCAGKTTIDRREEIKERDAQRDMEQIHKRRIQTQTKEHRGNSK